ncbi:hypothetical protein MJO28_013102 [Puccinia striiformis f. sp. tritici]|uniref:Uncharacterized protein n=2 Tax=Puccinia striiformis TaxID=27350 RepID=A0A2S4UZJ8_9BASI|nr:hypothetical protein MJO28_013102 [Puccinia striiformis f. sp. tritici]POW02673.1 hypothetical protein PSTT_11578 [Puccinia striiformis]
MSLHFGRLIKPVEKIDKACGWLWGTNSTRKTGTSRQVTPGLGVGRYCSKNGRASFQAPQSSHQPHKRLEEADEMMEELLYTDKAGGAHKDAQLAEDSGSLSVPTTGVSSILGQLKESISARSRLIVGQLAQEPEKDTTANHDDKDNDDKKKIGFEARFDSTALHQYEPALSDIPLPELPGFIWGNNSGLPIQMSSSATSDPSAKPSNVYLGTQLRGKEWGLDAGEKGKSTQIYLLNNPVEKNKEALSLKRNIHIPVCSSSRRGPMRVNGLTRSRSKHLFPGGYIGQSPTKKLQRKECTAP